MGNVKPDLRKPVENIFQNFWQMHRTICYPNHPNKEIGLLCYYLNRSQKAVAMSLSLGDSRPLVVVTSLLFLATKVVLQLQVYPSLKTSDVISFSFFLNISLLTIGLSKRP